MTPEGRIKNKIKKILDLYRGRIYYHMPVSAGYGASTLDYYGGFHGLAFAIEAKREGGSTTLRQDATILSMLAARMRVFVIHDDASLKEFADWLDKVDKNRSRHAPA